MIGQHAQPPAAPLEVRFHRLEVNYRWALTIAVVAVIALAGTLLFTVYRPSTATTGDQLAAKITTAWQKNDPALLEATYAADAVLVTAGGETYMGIKSIKGLSAYMSSFGFKPEVIGPVVRSGNTIVAPIQLTISGQVGYVTSIFEVNPAGLVVHHQDYGQH